MNHFLFLVVLVSVFVLFPSGPAGHALTPPSPIEVEAAHCDLAPANFITWFPKEITCPVCGTKNTFMVVGSYGTYIYQYPSKYQLIFWPYTDSASWYSCKKCRLTSFMGDFETVPKDKVSELQQMLKNVSLPAQKEVTDKELTEHPPYLDLPVSARLLVAEKVYQSLGQKTDGFWEHYYRVLGYHFAQEGKDAEAAEARKKALKIVEGWLTDKTREGERKEFLYICGAMHHFLSDDEAARKSFEEAAKIKYANPNLKAEENDGYNKYLSTLISEYLDMLKKGKGPKDDANKIAL